MHDGGQQESRARALIGAAHGLAGAPGLFSPPTSLSQLVTACKGREVLWEA